MEALYANLYKKYIKLKKEKDAEVDKLNHQQEEKFMNRVDAAYKLIEQLKSERDELHELVHELKNELASLRSTKDEQLIRYQNLLMEENLKNKDLSMEIEKLRIVEQRQDNILSRDYEDENGRANYHEDVSSHARKRSRQSLPLAIDYPADDTSAAAREEILVCLTKEPARELLCKLIEAPCCKRIKNNSEHPICMFQELAESIVGMKLSPLKENDKSLISVLHEPSGYAFTLELIDNLGGDEAEWVYRVSSLGTLKRIAIAWMRENVIKFSTSMFPIFFEKLSRVIELSS